MSARSLRLSHALVWAALAALAASFTGCGFIGGDDEPPRATDPCLDATLTASWPVEASLKTHLPGSSFQIDLTLGGTTASGIGTLLDGQVVFNGQAYGGGDGVTLQAPMRPGEYPLRLQRSDCPAQGSDYVITVAHPPALTAISPMTLPPSGARVRAAAVVWRDDQHFIAQFIAPNPALALIKVGADNDALTVISAVGCPDCNAGASAGLALSPDGRWLSTGRGLYALEGDDFFHWTTFNSSGISYSAPFFIDNNTLTLGAQPNGGLTDVVAIDLDTGARALRFADVGAGISRAAQGLVLIGGILYQQDTGALTGNFGVTGALGRLSLWLPRRNIAVFTQFSSSSLGQIAQVFPSQLLTRPDEACALPHLDARWIHDPLDQLAIGFGRRNGQGANPAFGVCALDATGRAWDRGWSVGGEVSGNPDTIRTLDAAWSLDGRLLVTAGAGGVQLWPRSAVMAAADADL